MEEIDKWKHYNRYGWTCSEENLDTLPASAPKGAKDLAQWLTLEGRRSSLEEWIGHAKARGDNTIHGKFWNIGAWTQRMSHSAPNSANIPAIWDDTVTPLTPVEQIKAQYDGPLRDLFYTDYDWLVGTDADGIQLRVLTHYMEDEAYREAIVSGVKSLKTDIHSLNQKALGSLICKSRDNAKTFIYAWLLGARLPKISRILGCSLSLAGTAERNFLRALPNLAKLKNSKIPVYAHVGYFRGLDDRKVMCDSEHLMLAGMLQSGEAIIMKHATVLWNKELKALGIDYKLHNFVHDEWQTGVNGTKEEAEEVGRQQCLAIEKVGVELGLFCPLKGNSVVGKTWRDTH